MARNKTEKATAYAYRLLNVRPRSEQELRDRLFRKGFDRATVYDVISSLKEKKAINDARFAELWVESRMHSNPKGDILLRKELKDKGIKSSVIEKVLSSKKEKEDYIAKALATKRFKILKKLPKDKAEKKLFDFLARRGFDFDVINDVINEIFRD